MTSSFWLILQLAHSYHALVCTVYYAHTYACAVKIIMNIIISLRFVVHIIVTVAMGSTLKYLHKINHTHEYYCGLAGQGRGNERIGSATLEHKKLKAQLN